MYLYKDSISLLINKFPELEIIYENNKDEYENLPNIFYESEFMAYLVNASNRREEKKLKAIFDFVEDLLTNGDEKVINLIEVAVIESIYYEKSFVNKKFIENYFGPLSIKSYKKCF